MTRPTTRPTIGTATRVLALGGLLGLLAACEDPMMGAAPPTTPAVADAATTASGAPDLDSSDLENGDPDVPDTAEVGTMDGGM